MGRQVVYCDKCGRMLREDDFDRGKAHTVENRSFCIECRPMEAAPPPLLPPITPKAFKHVSSTRIARPPSGETPRQAFESAPHPRPPSRAPLFVGVAVAAVALIVVAAVLLSGGRRGGGNAGGPEVDVKVTGAGSAEKGPTDTSAPPPPPPPPPPASEEPAKTAFLKAVELRKSSPDDLAGQFRAFEEVVQRHPTTSIAEVARREIMGIRRRISDEIGQLDLQARGPFSSEEYQTVIELWRKAKGRYGHADWTGPVEAKIKEANDTAASRYPALRARAADAKKIGDAGELKKQRDRVVRWGLGSYLEDLDKTLAAVVPDKLVEPPPGSKEAETYRASWREAMNLAARRDYEGASDLLKRSAEGIKEPGLKTEAAGDLGIVMRARAASTEAHAILAKTAKGQKVALGYADESGARAAVDGVVAATDGHRLEIRKGEESAVVLVGEVDAATLGELFRSRPAKSPEDERAAAFLCLIEGDAAAAKKMAAEPAPPAKYGALPGEARGADPKELEARRIFFEAERGYFDPAGTAEAIGQYKALLADFGQTGFVRRNRGAIASRTEGGKEHVLLVGELGATGNFKLAKHGGFEAWISTKDMEAAQLKESYVEVVFSAHADTDYRLWVHAGGCCQEVFGFFVQGTELAGSNPRKPSEMLPVPLGGDAVGAVKLPYLSVKKKHSDHTGPKEPDKWEWVQVPLQKYPTAGAKTVRLLTTQKGFAVSGAVVTALRPGPPRERDLADAERARLEIPGYALFRSGSATGGILREWWNGIGGGDLPNLTRHASFPDKPTGSKVEPSFAAPVDWADEYGTRMRGWVHPPATGAYVFWISGDDECELWLGTDDRPESKRKIASVPSWTSSLQWDKHGAQKSQEIPLVRGKRYYIEALHKEGSGGDSVAVGWQLPDGKLERPVPGNRLSAWGGKRR